MWPRRRAGGDLWEDSEEGVDLGRWRLCMESSTFEAEEEGEPGPVCRDEVWGEVQTDVLSISCLDAFSWPEVKAGKWKAGRVTAETFSITQRLSQAEKKGGGRWFLEWYLWKQVRKTDKEASVELIGIRMSMSFYVQGLYEPVCTQVSGKSYWGSVKVEIHSCYFCGL